MSSSKRLSVLATTTLFALAVPYASQAAGLTISLTPATASAGSSDNSFEVDLTNMGSSSMTVGGFSFQLTVSNPEISFTDATVNTATPSYIFAGHSTFGPDIITSPAGQSIGASDIFDMANSGTTLAPIAMVGLGEITFNVAANALPGSIPVDITAFPLSSLSDESGNNLTIGAFIPGQITIIGSTVPEPRSLLIALFALATFAILRSLQGQRQRFTD